MVLVHLGTNDIGQSGAQGVVDADANLRFIIGRLRVANPSVTILLARIIPIGAGSGYGANAGQVAPLNAAIDQIVSDLDTPQSPVLAVDLNTGFDLGTMLQSDNLHPNLVGEAFMSNGWRAVLETLLVAGNLPPVVGITAPANGASFADPAEIQISATATDANGSVTQVSFYSDGQLLGIDTTSPYAFTWMTPPLGAYRLTSIAEDDEGATTTSDAISVSILPRGGPLPIAVSNASFEEPPLPDADLAQGPGNFGGWNFSASENTFLGILNPPAGSYPSAGGSGTPTGAEGVNAAYLFNNGGPAEFVEATQLLSEDLAAGNVYHLQVAIERFLLTQPYAFSNYGGYRIELLAGSTVIASDVDTVDPPLGEFRDAVAIVASDLLNPALLGQPLSIRLTLSATDAPRSTHFDQVRLTRTSAEPVPGLSGVALGALLFGLLIVALGRGYAARSSAQRTQASAGARADCVPRRT